MNRIIARLHSGGLIPSRSLVAALLPPTIAALVACVFIVVRPIADLSQEFAFLVSTLQFLYFYPAGTLSALIESSALCLLGGVIALAYSNLFLYFAVLCNRHLQGQSDRFDPITGDIVRETVGARFVCSVGLLIVSLFAGWIRSTSPRLVNASRILVFHTVWSLVNASQIEDVNSSHFLLLFYPTLWSAIISILSLIIGHSILPPERKRLNDILGEGLKGLAEGVKGKQQILRASSRIDSVHRRTEIAMEAGGLDGPDGVDDERGEEETVQWSNAETVVEEDSSPAESTGKQGDNTASNQEKQKVSSDTTHTKKISFRPLVTLLPLIREQYSIALHGITYDPMSTRRLRPILTILYTHIGRNPIVKGLAKSATTTDLGDGERVFEQSHGKGKDRLEGSLIELRRSIATGLEESLRGIREAYDWHQDDSPGRQHLGGLLGFWQNYVMVKRNNRFEKDVLGSKERDPRRRLEQFQESLLNAVWTYEHDLLTWLETGFFGCPARGREITEREMKDMSSRDIARMLFKRDKFRGRRGFKGDDAIERGIVEDSMPGPKRNMDDAHKERVKAAAWLVAMLDLAKDVNVLCSATKELLQNAAQDRTSPHFKLQMKRFYFPLFDLAWLERGSLQAGLQSDRWHQEITEAEREDSEEQEDNREATEHEERLARTISHQRSQSGEMNYGNTAIKEKSETRRRRSIGNPIVRLKTTWMKWWESERTLSNRIRLSKWLSGIKSSRHIQYALKLALGVMLLALPGLLPLGSSSRRYFQSARGQWSVISYMYVLDVTTGATFRVGIWRVIGTVGGAIFAYVGYIIARGNAYGLTVIATLASIPIAWIMLFSSFPGIGIVAGITLPSVLFIPYLQRDSYSGVIIVALWRACQITIGIVAAFLVNMFIFPYHARTRYHKVVAKTLDSLGDLYLAMSRENLRPSLVNRAEGDQYAGLERSIEIGIGQCRSLATIQQLEISLLPKPHLLHAQLNNDLAKVFGLLVEIRNIRQGIPRRETVLDVLPLRQNLVSSVYVILFAVAHAARSRTPLPQFLASPVEAVNNWARAAEDHLQDLRSPSRSRSPSVRNSVNAAEHMTSPELAILYAFAEREALTQLCHTVEDLLKTAKTLFGVQSFLSQPRLTHADEEEILYR